MKMTKKFDKLNETFNVDAEIVPVETHIVEKKIESSKDDIKKDYEYARGNLYSLIEKGQEAINGVLELAQESDQARAYEVVGQLIKNTGEIAEKLLSLQKTLKDVEEDNQQRGPTTVNNALFVGSTAELAKLLKQQSEDNK
jgi:hypothetical protein